MGLSTKDNSPKSTREKIAELREKHQPIFEGIIENPQALFYPKMAYVPAGSDVKIISFYPSEVGKGEDIYTEFVSRDYSSEDPDRKLWKWKYNPHYKDEYDTAEPHAVTGDIRYIVPVDELQEIIVVAPWEPQPEEEEKEEIASVDFDAALPDPDQDAPVSDMTMRDYAAIHLNKAVSRKSWLNEIINSNVK